MWLAGYLAFVLAYGFGLQWAYHMPSRHRRRTAIAVVAGIAWPVAWTGQVLLIPLTRTGGINSTTLIPHLAVAGYSVCAGLVSGWWLSRINGLGRTLHLTLFAVSHAFMILLGGLLAVGLSGS